MNASRTALVASAFLGVLSSGALAGGRIVAAADANTLGTEYARSQEAGFAVNVARYITRGVPSARLLMIESDGAGVMHDYAPVVESALANAGYDVTVTQETDWTAQALSMYDGVFVGRVESSSSMVDTDTLAAFAEMGGGVYIFGGVGPGLATEPAILNGFLARYGLAFSDQVASTLPVDKGYNGLRGHFPITGADGWTHEIFDGVDSLGARNGLNVVNLGTNPTAAVVQFAPDGGWGMYGVAEAVPSPGCLALLGLSGLLAYRRKR